METIASFTVVLILISGSLFLTQYLTGITHETGIIGDIQVIVVEGGLTKMDESLGGHR